MSLAENLLKNMENDFVEYAQQDLEPHIVIDESRIANVPQSLRTIAVTGDKDILTIPFDCARFIDGHDLSTFAIYLNYVLPDGTPGTYIPDSITTSDGDGEYHFDWLIKNNITKTNGKISFAITAIKTKKNESGQSVVDKQWSSIPNGDCSIALGLDISNVPTEEETPDVVAQLSAILERIHGDVDEWIKTVLVQTTGNNTAKAMSQDAVTKELNKKIDKTSISQSTGNSTTDVMSQKSTTVAVANSLSDAKGYTDERENELNKKHLSNLEKISKNSKRITNLEKGIAPDPFETDDSVAYRKYVPEGALPYAEVTKIGGMTYRDETDSALKSAKVTEVVSVGVNMFGGDLLADKLVKVASATKNKLDGTVIYNASEISGKKIVSGFKPNTQYTIILYGKNTNDEQVSSNLRILYDDDTTKNLNFETAGADSYCVFTTPSYKTVKAINGFYAYSKTTLYYNKCGIFEGKLTVDDFIPHVKHTLPIPASVQSIDGYGWGIDKSIYNYIDFEKKQFVKCVGCVDLGTLTWVVNNSTTTPTLYYAKVKYIKNAPSMADKVKGILCEKYKNSTNTTTVDIDDKSIIRSADDRGYVFIKDSDFNNDADSFKASLSGVMLYYELAEPIITEITNTITSDNFIEVEDNGSLIFENENSYAVPSEVTYQLKGATA